MADDEIVLQFPNKPNPNLTDSATDEIKLLDAKSLLNLINYIELEANKRSFSDLALFIGAAQMSAAELEQDLCERRTDNEPT